MTGDATSTCACSLAWSARLIAGGSALTLRACRTRRSFLVSGGSGASAAACHGMAQCCFGMHIKGGRFSRLASHSSLISTCLNVACAINSPGFHKPVGHAAFLRGCQQHFQDADATPQQAGWARRQHPSCPLDRLSRLLTTRLRTVSSYLSNHAVLEHSQHKDRLQAHQCAGVVVAPTERSMQSSCLTVATSSHRRCFVLEAEVLRLRRQSTCRARTYACAHGAHCHLRLLSTSSQDATDSLFREHLGSCCLAIALQERLPRDLDVSSGVRESPAEFLKLALAALCGQGGFCFGAPSQLPLCCKLRLRPAWRPHAVRVGSHSHVDWGGVRVSEPQGTDQQTAHQVLPRLWCAKSVMHAWRASTAELSSFAAAARPCRQLTACSACSSALFWIDRASTNRSSASAACAWL